MCRLDSVPGDVVVQSLRGRYLATWGRQAATPQIPSCRSLAVRDRGEWSLHREGTPSLGRVLCFIFRHGGGITDCATLSWLPPHPPVLVAGIDQPALHTGEAGAGLSRAGSAAGLLHGAAVQTNGAQGEETIRPWASVLTPRPNSIRYRLKTCQFHAVLN